MAEYNAKIIWERGTQLFIDNKYSRAHRWQLDDNVIIPASSSPHIVPLPYSITEAIDPEEAFVASLSSCHMLWFLSIAANRQFCVDQYVDSASGIMSKDEKNKDYISEVTLQPKVVFSGNRTPTPEEIFLMHHEAHEACFIANSVKTQVVCKPLLVSSNG